MRLLHILFFLIGVQLMINGAFFSSPLLTALGAWAICLFILVAAKRTHHQGQDIWPTYHQMSTSTKETYFAPLALTALIGGALAYLFLPLEDVYAKTAVVMAGTWLVYLLLATFAHGRRMSIKNILGILFSLLLLLGVGGIIALWWQPLEQYTTRAYTSVEQFIITQFTSTGDSDDKIEDMDSIGTSGDITPTTGMVLSWISPSLPVSTPPDVDTPTTATPTTTTPTEENSPYPTTHTKLTYADLIPYIVNKYHLSAAGKPDVNFTNISKRSYSYYAFKAAYYARFFGKNVSPTKLVTCDNYAVFVWLADKWPLSYTAENVYSVFWNEAQKRDILNGCVQWAYVMWGNLD